MILRRKARNRLSSRRGGRGVGGRDCALPMDSAAQSLASARSRVVERAVAMDAVARRRPADEDDRAPFGRCGGGALAVVDCT